MFDDDQRDEDFAFDLGRMLYQFLYGFCAGHFISPGSTGQQLARLTAIPSILLGLVAISLLILSQPSFVMQGVACIGGLIWFCYTAWAAYTVEQIYVHDLEEAQRDEW